MATTTLTARDERERSLRDEVQEELRGVLSWDGVGAPDDEDIERARRVIAARVAAAQRAATTLGQPPIADPHRLEQRLLDDVLRFGALQPFLDNEQIEEVIVNGPLRVFVIAEGHKRLTDVTFADAHELSLLLDRIVRQAGARLDEGSPMVDARLPGGARLNAVIPPLVTAPHITIRKFLLRARTLDDLVELETLTPDAAAFLGACVRAGLNILISGGTGTGKTTALAALGAAIAGIDERVVTIEETPELQLDAVLPDCVALSARAANVEGAGGVAIRALARNALRMRPTRIIVGEVRGEEAIDMLGAMNSGHDGSMCTVHASGPREALSKLRTYALMADEDIPAQAVTEMIAEAIQIVVQLRLDATTHRRTVSHIYEVTGIEGDAIAGSDLFALQDGRLTWTGVRPRREARLTAAGYPGVGRGNAG